MTRQLMSLGILHWRRMDTMLRSLIFLAVLVAVLSGVFGAYRSTRYSRSTRYYRYSKYIASSSDDEDAMVAAYVIAGIIGLVFCAVVIVCVVTRCTKKKRTVKPNQLRPPEPNPPSHKGPRRIVQPPPYLDSYIPTVATPGLSPSFYPALPQRQPPYSQAVSSGPVDLQIQHILQYQPRLHQEKMNKPMPGK